MKYTIALTGSMNLNMPSSDKMYEIMDRCSSLEEFLDAWAEECTEHAFEALEDMEYLGEFSIHVEPYGDPIIYTDELAWLEDLYNEEKSC